MKVENDPKSLSLQINKKVILLSEEEQKKMFKVRKNLIKMLEDRGYTELEQQVDSFEAFKEIYKNRDQLNVIAKNPDSTDLIFVEFSNDEKIGLKHIEEFGTRLYTNSIKNGILIIGGSVTSLSKQGVAALAESKIYVEIFEEKELIVNITEHELVPKHVILNNAEKQELLSKYKLKENQLPKILLSDPVSKYLGLKRAQIVKIVRPSETAGKYITYRIAI
jgi:DNA-directed RNA polymerases I, II, and III subunit RPABC1